MMLMHDVDVAIVHVLFTDGITGRHLNTMTHRTFDFVER